MRADIAPEKTRPIQARFGEVTLLDASLFGVVWPLPKSFPLKRPLKRHPCRWAFSQRKFCQLLS